MTRDTFEAKGESIHLTEHQKRNIKFVYDSAEDLSMEDGKWQNDNAVVIDTGVTIMWLLEQAFPFLWEEVKDE